MSKEQQKDLLNYFKKKQLAPYEAQKIMDNLSLAISIASLKETLDKAKAAEK